MRIWWLTAAALLVGGCFAPEGEALYASSWMDSGPTYYYSVAPRWVMVVLFVSLPALLLAMRSFAGAIWLGLLAAGTFNGWPTELMGGLVGLSWLILSGLLLYKRELETRKKNGLMLGVGWLILIGAIGLGYPKTISETPGQCRGGLKNLQTAWEMYQTDYGPPESLEQLTPNYLRTLPRCSSGTRSFYTMSVVGDRVVLECSNPIHVKDGREKPRLEFPMTPAPSEKS